MKKRVMEGRNDVRGEEERVRERMGGENKKLGKGKKVTDKKNEMKGKVT